MGHRVKKLAGSSWTPILEPCFSGSVPYLRWHSSPPPPKAHHYQRCRHFWESLGEPLTYSCKSSLLGCQVKPALFFLFCTMPVGKEARTPSGPAVMRWRRNHQATSKVPVETNVAEPPVASGCSGSPEISSTNHFGFKSLFFWRLLFRIHA